VAGVGDAEILTFLARHAFGPERVAAPEPVSVLDGHSVLVTEVVQAVPRTERRDTGPDGSGPARVAAGVGGPFPALMWSVS
jgi:hypothetical protein